MMEKEYYIVVNDNRVGPLSYTELASRSIEPSTMVWTAGMPDWARADTLQELMPLFANRTRIDENESAFGSYARPVEPGASQYPKFTNPQPNQPYGNNQYGAYGNPNQQPQQGYTNPPYNWKTLSIVATIVGFLFSCIGGIVGAFAIAQASKAQNALRYGDTFTAQSAASTCKTLCIVSFVLSGIGLIVNILSLLGIFSISSLVNPMSTL